MIHIGGCRVVDVRFGRVPVERVCLRGEVVWERELSGLYLYAEREEYWLTQEAGSVDVRVYSNTDWCIDDDSLLRVLPGSITFGSDTESFGVVEVCYGGTWEVQEMGKTNQIINN